MKLLVFSLLAASLCSPSVYAEQLLESGSFEMPPVTKRKPRSKGADLVKFSASSDWVKFTDQEDAKEGGKLILGVTNEVSRTGRQSIFVHFDGVTRPNATAQLSSSLISIRSGKPYHFAIYGRVDKDNPLTKDQRLPYLKLRIDWFMADKEEQTGEVEWRVQPMPGSKNRKPLFVMGKWTEYFADVVSPEGAAFAKVTWFWETTPEVGSTEGVIYFDDAVIVGEPGPVEVEEGEEGAVAEKPTEDMQETEAVVPLSTKPETKPDVEEPEEKKEE